MNACDSQMHLSDCFTQGNDKIGNSKIVKTYKKRFWMLFLFSFLSMLCGMLYPEYVIMADVTICFYGVSEQAVNWTGLIYMVTYIILVFPVSWLMNVSGLRTIVLLGSTCNTISCAIQFATFKPTNYPFVMLVAFFGSLSNVCVLAIPPCLAAVWFPSDEISRACSIGVFGNQLGIALGFVISPLLISSDCSRKDIIADGKRNLAIILATVNIIVLLLVIFTFQNVPEHSPSIAQAEKQEIPDTYIQSFRCLVKNKDFVLLFFMYGLMVGTYFAVATLLNYLIRIYFPEAHTAIGWMGMILIVTGLVGSIIAGYILDYTHKFKETSIFICGLSFLSYIAFSCILIVNKIWLQFISIGILGFFLTSILPVGFEYGIEITYPTSEIVSAGILNSSSMIFGIIITEIVSSALEMYGAVSANAIMCVVLLLSTAISCFITKEYKRSKKNAENTSTSL